MEKNDLSAVQTAIPDVEHHDGVRHVDDTNVGEISAANPDLTAEAKEASQAEKSMSLTQALKLYPKAVGWSLLLSTAIVMEGYDTLLLGNFYAFPPFTERY